MNEELGLIDGFVGGFVVGDAWEDERDERGGIRGGRGGVFGQDGCVVSYACAVISSVNGISNLYHVLERPY